MAWYGIDKDGKTCTSGMMWRRDGMIALLTSQGVFRVSALESMPDAQLEGLVRSLGAKGFRLAESSATQAVGRPFRVARVTEGKG